MEALRSQVVVQSLVGAAVGGRLGRPVAVRVTLVAGQTLQTGAGLAVAQQVAPRRAGALVATGRVEAAVGAGLRQPLALINVCPQRKDRPAPGKRREDGRQEGEKKRVEGDGEEGVDGWKKKQNKTDKVVQAVKREEGHENEGRRGGGKDTRQLPRCPAIHFGVSATEMYRGIKTFIIIKISNHI